MPHIAFLVYLLALASGAAAVIVATLFYLKFRRKVILHYVVVLVVISLILAARMLVLYGAVSGASSPYSLERARFVIERLAYMLGLFIGPFFACEMIGIAVGRVRKYVFFALAGVFAAVTLVELALSHSPVAMVLRVWAGAPVLFGVYVYLMVLGAVYLGKLGSRALNIALKVVVLVSVVVLPFAFVQYIHDRPFLPFYLENAVSLLVVALFSIGFSFVYFGQPPLFNKSGPSEYFRSRYSVTAREAEIVGLVLEGCSNAQIGEKLYISPRTVESHLYSIFQKTGVKSRVQLINLIQTNRTD